MNAQLTERGLSLVVGTTEVTLDRFDEDALRNFLNGRGSRFPGPVPSGAVTHDVGGGPRVPLFQRGQFTLASGRRSTWKIECDALTPDDWAGLAEMAAQTVLRGATFKEVHGVPRGGMPLADALSPLVWEPKGPPGRKTLLVEDVVTTGGSIDRYRASLGLAVEDVVGIAVFARGTCPDWVRPLFQMPEGGVPVNQRRFTPVENEDSTP